MKVAHEGFAAKKRAARAESKASSPASSMKRSRFRSIDRTGFIDIIPRFFAQHETSSIHQSPEELTDLQFTSIDRS